MAVPAPAPAPAAAERQWTGLYRAEAEDPEFSEYLELSREGETLRGVYTGAMDRDFQAWFQAPVEQLTLGPDGTISFVVGRRVLHPERVSPKTRVDPANEGAGYADTPLKFEGRLVGEALELRCAPVDECSKPTLRFVRVGPND